MKPYRIISAELTNFETFQSYPGAAEFREKFSSNHTNASYYKFYTEKECKSAETKLNELGLKYQLFYGIELITEDEIYNYPAIAVNPLVEYDLLVRNDKKDELNFKKIGAKNYLKDFTSEKFIFSEKTKKIFDQFCPKLTYKQYVNEKNGKKYFVPKNIPELSEPMIIEHVESIEESSVEGYKDTFYPQKSDGRIKLTDKSLKQIETENFCICSYFSYNKKSYKQASSNVFASGKLALELIKQFAKERSFENNAHPYTLGNI